MKKKQSRKRRVAYTIWDYFSPEMVMLLAWIVLFILAIFYAIISHAKPPLSQPFQLPNPSNAVELLYSEVVAGASARSVLAATGTNRDSSAAVAAVSEAGTVRWPTLRAGRGDLP